VIAYRGELLASAAPEIPSCGDEGLAQEGRRVEDGFAPASSELAGGPRDRQARQRPGFVGQHFEAPLRFADQ
jgi:hypothetical protein